MRAIYQRDGRQEGEGQEEKGNYAGESCALATKRHVAASVYIRTEQTSQRYTR